MKRSLALFALAVLGACAETRSAGRSTAQAEWCNPCPMPCALGCAGEQFAVAPAPQPASVEPAAAFAPPAGEQAGPQPVEPAAPPPPAEVARERLRIADHVRFDTGTADIHPRSYALLDEIAAAIRDHPEVKRVHVEGHADARGDADMNMRLSRARAEAVRKYLVDRGVEDERLHAAAYGEERPIADNETEAGREANRRVEFVVAEE